MTETIMITVLTGIFGAGGIVQLIKTILDYRAGVSKKREDKVDELEKRIKELEADRDLDHRWQAKLVRILIDAGLTIPEREEKKE